MDTPARSDLTICFLDEEFLWTANAPMTFGSAGDLVLDANPEMPRSMGSFSRRGQLWWLCNSGPEAVVVIDLDSDSSVHIAAGCSFPIAMRRADVICKVGPARYSFEINVRPARSLGNGDPSLTAIRLNDEQRQLIDTLCRAEAALPGSTALIKSNAEMAADLGWSLPKFNRKLDNLCLKFSRIGVHGLHGSKRSLASNRRRRLAEYCVSSGLAQPVFAGS